MDKLSGYIEVELGGELRPLKFGMGAWQIISQERGKPIEELFTGLGYMDFIALTTWAALRCAYVCEYTKVEPPKDIIVVFDWLGDCDVETYKQIGKAFGDSKMIGETMREYMAKHQINTEDSTLKKKKPLKK
jgi:hypothetical protein